MTTTLDFGGTQDVENVLATIFTIFGENSAVKG